MRGSESRVRSSRLVVSALFCALIILGTYIRLPFFIPITLQLVFTNASALLLGSQWGYLPSLLYLACGMIGLPVFSFGGGISGILSPSFGFVVGFVPGSLACAFINEKGGFSHKEAIGSITNLACVYFFGTLHYLLLSRLYLMRSPTVEEVFSVCIAPFIAFDMIKLWASVLLYRKIKRGRTN